LGFGKNSSFLAKNALETHCFVLGGNEFRLRVFSLRREKRSGLISHQIFIKTTGRYYYVHTHHYDSDINLNFLCFVF